MNEPASTPKKIGEITEQLTILERILESLSYEVDGLACQLVPALRPMLPEGVEKEPARMSLGSELGERLYNYCESANGLVLRIQSIRNRLEL